MNFNARLVARTLTPRVRANIGDGMLNKQSPYPRHRCQYYVTITRQTDGDREEIGWGGKVEALPSVPVYYANPSSPLARWCGTGKNKHVAQMPDSVLASAVNVYICCGPNEASDDTDSNQQPPC